MRLHSRQQALSPSPPSSRWSLWTRHVRWSDLQTAAAAAAEWILRHFGVQGAGRWDDERERSVTQPYQSISPNLGPDSRARAAPDSGRRLHRCRRHTALKLLPFHTRLRLQTDTCEHLSRHWLRLAECCPVTDSTCFPISLPKCEIGDERKCVARPMFFSTKMIQKR